MFKTNTLPAQRLPFILLPLLLSSCASIINSPVQCISIATDKNMQVVSVNKAILIDSLPPNANNIFFVARVNSHSSSNFKQTVALEHLSFALKTLLHIG